MEHSQTKLTNGTIINFSHHYHFMVTNLIKITSMRIEKFRASLGRSPGGEQSFVWGRYNLLINYRAYQREEEKSRLKEFPRGFSFALNDCVLQVGEIEEMEENLRCECSFTHGMSPITLGLFPLLSKINFIPFKIDVTVNGSIISIPLKTEPLPDIQEEKLEKEVFAESFISSNQLKKDNNNDTDLISREKKKKAALPSLNPQYYKKHQLFYDYFFNNRPQEKEKNE